MSPPPLELLAAILQGYADRALFRGFSRGPVRSGRASFKILWHRDRLFELIADVRQGTLRFPVVLPEVPAGSEMYKQFRQFVAGRSDEDLPEHRRIDRGKATVRCSNRGGNIALTLTVVDADYDYGCRKLINLVHEIFLEFLMDGPYYEYMVETFHLDPDHM